MSKTYDGWHFLPEDGRLARGDGRLVVAGQTLAVAGPPRLYHQGLHASERALDALSQAPGPIVERVVLGGEVLRGVGKAWACATERACLWLADATTTLHEFACWCAEQALTAERAAGREPDARCWAAIETKRRWLAGAATDEELELAAAQAAPTAGTTWSPRAAAWSAARAAAWDAARAAAWSAARDAARDAAHAGAWARARARQAGTEAATEAAQNAELERRLWLLAPAGAEEAAH